MNLFVYADLDQHLQQYLAERLPKSVTPYFHPSVGDVESEEAFASAEVLYGNPPASWFTSAPSGLQFWQLESAGFNQYQGMEMSATVANMGDFFSEACAETMVGGIMAFYRGIPTLVKLQEEKKWQSKLVRTSLGLLSHKEVVILGAGTIGQAIKKMLSGFSATVKMVARQNPIADFHSKEELYRHLPYTDLVINTLPGNLDNYVSEEFISFMKKGSLYANVGRGNTTDEGALISAIQTGHLAGAVLDVTEIEPLPESNTLWEMDNVLLTQHTGGGQAIENTGKIDRFVENLHRYINKENVLDQVNLYRGY